MSHLCWIGGAAMLAGLFTSPALAEGQQADWRALASPENSQIFYFLRGPDCVFMTSPLKVMFPRER